jgi:hypothetical protein
MILSLTQSALLALGLMACLSLFLALKHEMHRRAKRDYRKLEEMALQVQEVSERQPEEVIVPSPPRSGLNLSRRVQAMRMLRRGEDVSHIAAALGVPRQEVELLIRVQRLVRESVAGSHGVEKA